MYSTIRNFDIEKIKGIGEITAKKLHDAGLNTIDLLAHSSPVEINSKTGIAIGLSTQHYSRARMALTAIAGIGDFTITEECMECNGRGVVYRDEMCPRCKGTTKTTFDDKDPCISCSGLGVITENTMDDCSVCGGDGAITMENIVTCSVCRGTGVETYNVEYTCNRCLGKGSITQYHSVSCSQCGGDGKIEFWDPHAHVRHKTCPTCNGSGYDATDIVVGVLASIFFPVFAAAAWALNRCDQCGGNGYIVVYEGDNTSLNCTACGGDGRISQTTEIDCPACINGVVVGTHTRACTACGGDGGHTSTLTAQCGACHGLGKTLNVSREQCSVCQGTGTKIEHHELGCATCGETGTLKAFAESKCLRCKGEGIIAHKVSEFSGMDLKTFVSSPTETLVATGALNELSALAMKRAIGTLFFVLDEPCMRDLVL